MERERKEHSYPPAHFSMPSQPPPTVACKMEAQLDTLHTCFCTFGIDLRDQSAINDKISASELSRKFIKRVLFKSALLVGFFFFFYSECKNL